MRIDHIVTCLGPGGAEYLAANLAVEQSKRGHDVRVWTLAEDAAGADARDVVQQTIRHLAAHDVEVQNLGNHPRRPLNAGMRIRRRTRSTSQGPVDVVHAHSAVALAASIIGDARPKKVLTLHSSEVSFPRSALRLMSPFTDEVVAVSLSTARAWAGVLKSETRVIPNGVVLPTRPAVLREAKNKRLELIAVGAMREEKNYQRMLRAFSRAQGLVGLGQPAPRLTIVGSGPEMTDCIGLSASLGLTDHVRFLGTRSDVAQLIGDADVFVSSSDFEGMPIAMLEAMAGGRPCISTPFPAARELLSSGAGLVAGGFSDQLLATEFERVFRGDLDVAAAGAVASRVVQSYSISTCADRYERAYRGWES